jgi:hypothetical protein
MTDPVDPTAENSQQPSGSLEPSPPATPTATGEPPAAQPPTGWAPEPTKGRSWRRLILTVVLVVFASGVVRTVATAITQDPVDAAANKMLASLPAEARDRLRTEIKATIASQTGGLSEDAARAKISDLTRKGFSRLDDQSAIRRLLLQTKALAQTDVPTCASFGRASLGATTPDPQVVVHLIAALDQKDLQEWFELTVAAMKLEIAGQQPAQTVTEAQFEAVITPIVARYSQDDLAALQRVSSAPTQASDADACAVVRRLYQSTVGLAPSDLVVVARYDIQP